jgi:hypothetical protein
MIVRFEMSVPVLLDALTVFFLVAGSVLLWINLRRRAGDVITTKLDDDGPSL